MTDPVPALFHELLFGAPPPPIADEPALRAWLLERNMSQADSEALLASDLRGLFVYRRLVRQTLLEALGVALPKSMARLGTLFDEYFERFLRERGTRTHFLREVTSEFLAFAEPLFMADRRIPPYLPDLARHEALHIEIAALETRSDSGFVPELRVDGKVRFSEACRLVRYGFAVHRLPSSSEDRTLPEAAPTTLFVYRAPDHEVRYLELSALAGGIVERLLNGHALGDAIRLACDAYGTAVDESVLDGLATLLGDLAERGALLGSETAR